MASHDDFELANQRAREMEGSFPRVVAAHYVRKTGRIVLKLSSKVIVSFSPADVEGLEDAKPSQLNTIENKPVRLRHPFSRRRFRPLRAGDLRGLSGFQEVDGGQVGPGWRPIQEQR